MVDNETTPVESPQGGDGDPADQKWYDKVKEEDVITARKLQGILNASTSTLEKRIETKLGDLKGGLSEVVKEALRAEKDAAGDDKKGKPTEQEAELAKMQRKLEEAEVKITALVSNLDKSQQREVATTKRQLIMNALGKHDCTKSEAAYKVIADDVKVEDGKAFVLQDNGFGAEEQVPLEEFVEKTVRETLLPELFRGANRGGSPASGDESGGGAKGFKYDWDKIKDDQTVLASPEFAKALDKGLVSNMHQGVPHTSGIR